MQPPREADDIALSNAGALSNPPHAPHASGAFVPDALAPGSRLDEFEIVRVLGAGGFGIVYLALDQVLLRYVAIKEFIPTALAGRTPQGAIAVRSVDAAKTFEVGLDSFFNEGRLLARFDNPSLVRVFRFWKANGTAYMAMQYYPGQTLREARRQMAAPPDEAWLRLFVERLLGALETLHAEGVYHRDIAPDNILLLPDGQPVILDFGSARRVISDRTQSLTAILKPNYSPVEQYADDAGMRQGGYTDLYALGGTVYFMLTGREPTPAVMRAVRDSFPVLAHRPTAEFTRVSSAFLAVIDWMLGVSPDDRPQTVAATRAALCGEIAPPPPTARHGVLIGDPDQPDDPARAMAPTEIAASAGTNPTGTALPARSRQRGRAWLAMSALGLAASAALLWALPGAPQRSPAPSQAGVVATAVAAEPPASEAVAQAASVASEPRASASVEAHRPAAEGTTAPNRPPPPARPVASAAVSTALRPASVKAPPVTKGGAEGGVAVGVAIGAAVGAAPSRSPPGGAAPCADLTFFARAACLSRACAALAWRSNPQCVEARRIAEQRERRMGQ